MSDLMINGEYGKYVSIYRFMMERKLGRELTSNEVVHHKDFNHENNKISNLQVMSRSEHSILHGKVKKKKVYTPQEETENSIIATKIKCILAMNNLSRTKIAKEMNMGYQRFKRKVEHKNYFTEKELNLMCQIIDVDIECLLDVKSKKFYDLPKYNSLKQVNSGLLT